MVAAQCMLGNPEAPIENYTVKILLYNKSLKN
jgi:hypothetical protein